MLKITNPATGESFKQIEEDTAETIRQKFQAAKTAQKKWNARPLAERADMIRRFRSYLVRDIDMLAEILTSEVGKPISQSKNELKGVLGRIDFFLEATESTVARQPVHTEKGLEEAISFEPLGVIANISAWNYPYLVGSNVFIPALLTGNAVLYKPSEFSALTGLAIAERMAEAGVPTDVFTCIVGDGKAGAALLAQPIAGVYFTGSYATGKKIAETVAGRMIRVHMELGGKDPTYVCDDIADIASAAAGLADGAFYNNGQSCCSVERIYVHEKIYDPFVKAFEKTVLEFITGDPRDEKTYIGPLTRSAQLKIIEAQVADAVAKGGKILCGGKPLAGPGNYFQPTVIINANEKMELMREESFGPIIGIQKVRDDREALDLMNDSEYGLTAGVYSKDRARAEKIMADLNAGSAYWNCCDRVSPRLPWTGRGHSGIGSSLSRIGIQAFVQPKAWHLRG